MTSRQAVQKIWITGASTGIGAALARRLLEQGCPVIETARSPAGLQTLADDFPATCLPLALDLTDVESLAAGAERLHQLTGYLDAVVVNAGICEYIDVPVFFSCVV